MRTIKSSNINWNDEDEVLGTITGFVGDLYDELQRLAKIYGLTSGDLKGSRGVTLCEGLAAEIFAAETGSDAYDFIHLINNGTFPNSGVISEAFKRR